MFDIWVISFPTTWCMVNLQIHVFHRILGPQAPQNLQNQDLRNYIPPTLLAIPALS